MNAVKISISNKFDLNNFDEAVKTRCFGCFGLAIKISKVLDDDGDIYTDIKIYRY